MESVMCDVAKLHCAKKQVCYRRATSVSVEDCHFLSRVQLRHSDKIGLNNLWGPVYRRRALNDESSPK